MPESEKIWWFETSDKRLGPYSETVLMALVANGKVAPTDLVWKEGMVDWAPLMSLSKIKSSLSDESSFSQRSTLIAMGKRNIGTGIANPKLQKRFRFALEMLIVGLIWAILTFLHILYMASNSYDLPPPLEYYERNPANVMQVEGKLHYATTRGRSAISYIRFERNNGQTITFSCFPLQQEFCGRYLWTYTQVPLEGPMPVRMVLVNRESHGYWPLIVESDGVILLDRRGSYTRYQTMIAEKYRQNPPPRMLSVLFMGACTLLGYFIYKIIKKRAETKGGVPCHAE